MKAGFKQVDISPVYFPIRTYLGAVNEIVDPIFANAAVFDNGIKKIVLISLDIVIIEWEYADRIRKGVSKNTGIPESSIMVSTTHNHACPAVVDRPTCMKEGKYIDYLILKSIDAATKAAGNLKEVVIGTGSGVKTGIAFNRRFIKRNGTNITQPLADLDEILCSEGVIDSEVGVLVVRSKESGKMLGILTNYGCHAVHLMGKVSAGFPGVLANCLKKEFDDDFVSVFLNGPCGNVIHYNYLEPNGFVEKEEVGRKLAQSVISIVNDIEFNSDERLEVLQDSVKIKYRPLDELEQGVDKLINIFDAIRNRGWYDYSLEVLREKHAKADHETAVIQALRIGDATYTTIPAEYFNEHGLRIKLENDNRFTWVISLANGWLGYVPTQEAFTRKGGHESTLALWSKMEYKAGDIMADKALELLKQI
ncbi:MAG: hypothetical protein GY750_15150 [Lentisphaerae bacterium]|nr:hypothetical protein [Lentisphaerota bacterium]MCP4102735.1 hypothetical protein [Lentisphaerota bacterium]